MMIEPRPEVVLLSEAVHGAMCAAELIELGIDPATVLDFSASVNPFGPSLQAVAALNQVPFDRYPDREAIELRRTLSARLDVSPECLIAGNGSSELLAWIALAYLRTGDAVMIAGPTYSEYARVAALMGARVVCCDAVARTNFAVPIEQILHTLHELRPRAFFLCNPNNPTGQCVTAEQIRCWSEEFPQTLFVIDEAYIEFANTSLSVVGCGASNVIVLRSLTKAYSLAGLRLGYAVAAEEIVRVLCRVRPPWSVNALAQAAGTAALKDDCHLQHCLRLHRISRQQLELDLTALGLSPLPSTGPFFLVRVNDASSTRRDLLAHGILVRDCTSFGLPGWIRISPRGEADNHALCAAVSRIIGSRTQKSAGHVTGTTFTS